MATLLFPGRHLLHTRFQEQYLEDLFKHPPHKLDKPKETVALDQIVFAITSCNQENSRYNPIPFHVRAIGVDRFAQQFRSLGIEYRIVGIPHYGHTPMFVENLLKEIKDQTEGNLILTPANTVVMCSTPELMEYYVHAGFTHILPAELKSFNPMSYHCQTPLKVLQSFAESSVSWQDDRSLQQALSSATLSLWHDFPEIPTRIRRLYQDPILTDDGSLTKTRNYSVYAQQMGHQEIINIKYDDVKKAIKPGKIVDEGCADGALLAKIAQDFPDSDLLGIEITGEFIARAKERQRAGEFGGSYVHFHQRNLMDNIFDPGSIDTTICNSTLHELWSYGEGEKTVKHYLHRKFQQLRPGGRLIIRDVVDPQDKEREIYLWCNSKDGDSEEDYLDFPESKDLAQHLEKLSTYARFPHFRQDFLAHKRDHSQRDTQVTFKERKIGTRKYYRLPLKDAVEFMTHKDYVENWKSEMHEEFAFWNFKEWKNALQEVGFSIMENPNHPESNSRVYTNPWIAQQRWKGKVELYKPEGTRMKLIECPPTTMILVGEKR